MFVIGADAFLGDRKLGDVDHARVSVAVDELQGAVPLPLHAAHHSIGRVVLHFRSHPVATQEQAIIFVEVSRQIPND